MSETAPQSQGPTLRGLVKGIALILILAGIGWALEATGLARSFDQAWIDSEIRGQGLTGEALFVMLAACLAAVGIPRQLVSFLAGYAFGLVEGTALALLATGIGCVLTFTMARLAGRNFVRSRFPKRFEKIDRILRHDTFNMAVLIRFLPVGNNALTNVFAGVSSVALLPFLSGSVLGYVPQTLVFVLAGSGVQVDPELRITLSVALFVLSALMGLHLWRKAKRSRELPDLGKAEE